MVPDPIVDPSLQTELESVYRLYAALVGRADAEDGLGGKLVFAGELDREGFRLVRAANIAGAASLGATADVAMQRKAIHEGVIDFLVTSLDEALRILKNEIRKHNAVSVGVEADPLELVAGMRQRGVLPDVVRGPVSAEWAVFVAQGALVVVDPASMPEGHRLLVLENPPADFQARALSLVREGDHAARRWVRLSPRYLGPQARQVYSVPADDKLAAEVGRLQKQPPS